MTSDSPSTWLRRLDGKLTCIVQNRWCWTISTMAFSASIYAFKFGIFLSIGFVILILIHELGHLFAAKKYHVRTGAPLFIPYIGAILTADTRTIPRWHVAVLGMGGPLVGSLGAFFSWGIYGLTGNLYFAEIALMGVALNLFNLLPIGFLDGGLISLAFTQWLKLPGYLILLWLTWHFRNPFLIFTCILTLPSTLSVIFEKPRPTTVVTRISTDRRIVLGIIYVALIALLGFASWSLLTQVLTPAYIAGKGHLVFVKKAHHPTPQ